MSVCTFLIFGLVACSSGRAPNFQSYVGDPTNGLRQTITVGNTVLTAEYTPSKNLISRLKRNQDETTSNNTDSVVYFKFVIQNNNALMLDDSKAEYLTFEVTNDFSIQSAGGTKLPLFVQKVEKGVRGTFEYILCFEINPDDSSLKLVFIDKIFGTGSTAFVFLSNDMQRIPPFKEVS